MITPAIAMYRGSPILALRDGDDVGLDVGARIARNTLLNIADQPTTVEVLDGADPGMTWDEVIKIARGFKTTMVGGRAIMAEIPVLMIDELEEFGC